MELAEPLGSKKGFSVHAQIAARLGPLGSDGQGSQRKSQPLQADVLETGSHSPGRKHPIP